MAWTGDLGLAVGSVLAYASVHGLKFYVFPVQRHFCIFAGSLPYTHNPQVNKYSIQVRSYNRWYSTSEDSTKISTINTRRRGT
jgi:hypothetical protein